MRNTIALLLALMMCLTLCACGTDEPKQGDAQTTGIWYLAKPTDEFGDATDDSIVLAADIEGEFSNTATASSDLSVRVIIAPVSKGAVEFNVEFGLLEYGDNPINYTSQEAESIVLKTKVGDTVEEYSLTGNVEKGTLLLSGDNSKNDNSSLYGNAFYCNLINGNDIRCIITIGSSKYTFTVESSNIVEANTIAYDSASEISKTVISNLLLSAFPEMRFNDYYAVTRSCNIEKVTYTGNAYFAKMLTENGGNGLIGQDAIAFVYQLEGTYKTQEIAEKVGSDTFTYYGMIVYRGINPEMSEEGITPKIVMLYDEAVYLADPSLIDEAVADRFPDGPNGVYQSNTHYEISKFE